MAATPFKGTLTLQGASGQTYSLPVSCDDVAGDFVTFAKSGLTFFTPPELVYLTDIALVASGVDTKRIDLWINGADANIAYQDDAVKVSIPLPRLPNTVPIVSGATIQFKQSA